jgi:hypothetical protein
VQKTLLDELFDSPDRPEADGGGRYRGVTNERLMNDEGASLDPKAPTSKRSKDRLVGGKPVRFNEPRQYTAVIIVVLLLALGYAGFVAFHQFWTYWDNAAARAEEARKDAALHKGRSKIWEEAAKKAKGKNTPKPAVWPPVMQQPDTPSK